MGASDALTLLDWLRVNDYQVDPAAKEIFNTYINQDWAFVAIKLNSGEMRQYMNEFLPPLTIKYEHDQLIFPLRISSVSSASDVKITVYVIAESTASSSNIPTAILKYDRDIRKGLEPKRYVETCIRRMIRAVGGRALVVMRAAQPH